MRQHASSAKLLFGLSLAIMLALAPSSAQAEDLCSSFQAPLSQQEIADLSEDLLAVIPVQHRDVARAVRIRNVVATTETFAPAAIYDGRGGYEIQVPDMFRRLQCQVIYLYFAKLTNHLEESRLRTAADVCMKKVSGDPVICTYLVPMAAFEQLEKGRKYEGHDYTELKRTIEKYTRSAFYTLMLHEYAHVILRHFGNITMGIEIEADAFAATYGQFVLDGQSGENLGLMANFGTFAILSFSDGFMRTDILHPPFACRAGNVATVAERWQNEISLLWNWPYDTPTAFKKQLDGYGPIHGLVYPDLAKDMVSARCEVSNTALLNGFEADLRELRLFVTRANQQELAGARIDPVAFYEPLMALKLKSNLGRSIRGKIVSLRLREMHKTRGDSNAAKAYLPVLRAFLSSKDARLLTAEDYGRLLAIDAFYLPDSKGQQKLAKLSTAIDYNPKFTLAYFFLAVTQLRLGQCDASLATFDKLNARAGEDASDETAQLLERIRNKIQVGIASQGCERFTKDLLSGAVTLP